MTTIGASSSQLSARRAASLLGTLVREPGHLGERDIFRQVRGMIDLLGDLKKLNLPRTLTANLEQIQAGILPDPGEVLRGLALVISKIGIREEKEARKPGLTDPALTQKAERIDARNAIHEIFQRLRFDERDYQKAFLARMVHPENGFAPFKTKEGTEAAFFSSPDSLGEPWKTLTGPHWANGIGLIVFRNNKASACGMIFIHGLGKVSWSKIQPDAWHCSGGSMAFGHDQLTFQEALDRVVDKAVAMTWKWRAVDESLVKAGHGVVTELGGSKGIVLHGAGDELKRKALEVYAEVLNLTGVCLTGSDEGIDAWWAEFLAKKAPYNVYGNRHSKYKGRVPTDLTADGIYGGIRSILSHQYPGVLSASVLVQGYGGMGTRLVERLAEGGIRVAGIIETDEEKLLAARKKGIESPLFLLRPKDRRQALGVEASRRGIQVRDDLAEVFSSAGTCTPVIFSPNAAPHPITFGVAEAMILGGVLTVVGAANNQLSPPEEIGIIELAAGIFNSADFDTNRMGATAVVSDAVGLTEEDLQHQLRLVREGVAEDYREAFLKGTSPYSYRLRKAGLAWNRILMSERGIGGKFTGSPLS